MSKRVKELVKEMRTADKKKRVIILYRPENSKNPSYYKHMK